MKISFALNYGWALAILSILSSPQSFGFTYQMLTQDVPTANDHEEDLLHQWAVLHSLLSSSHSQELTDYFKSKVGEIDEQEFNQVLMRFSRLISDRRAATTPTSSSGSSVRESTIVRSVSAAIEIPALMNQSLIPAGACRPLSPRTISSFDDQEKLIQSKLDTYQKMLERGPSFLGLEDQLFTKNDLKYLRQVWVGSEKSNRAFEFLKILEPYENLLYSSLEGKHDVYKDLLRDAQLSGGLDEFWGDDLKAVLKAKKLCIELGNNPGSILSLESYRLAPGAGAQTSEIGLLEETLNFLLNICDAHSNQIDQATNQNIVSDHFENRNTRKKLLGKEPLRVFIQGGGPIGLLASIKALESGALVSLATDRGEVAGKKQIIRFDPNWQRRLNYYVGLPYRHLQASELARQSHESERPDGIKTTMVYMPLQENEQMLKDKAVELWSTVESESKARREQHSDPYRVVFETKVLGIRFPTAKGEPFQVETVKVNGKQVLEGSYRLEPVTIIGAAGGVGNFFRDEYLSPASAHTEPLTHSVSVWNKTTAALGQDLLIKPADHTPQFVGFLKFGDIAQALETSSPNFDEFIKKGIEEIVRFSRITVPSKYSSGLISMLRADPSKEVEVRKFENAISVYVGYVVPQPLADLRKEVLKWGEISERKRNLVDAFLEELEKRWHQAAITLLTGNGANLLVRDSSPISNGFFEVVQNAPPETVKIYRAFESTLTIVALGDSVVGPHFMTWSGLNSGRVTVDDFASALLEYNQFDDVEKFARTLREKHRVNKDFILGRGKAFLTPLSSDQLTAEAFKSMVKTLDLIAQRTEKTPVSLGQVGIKKGAKAGSYAIVWKNNSPTGAKEHQANFLVNPSGTLSAEVAGKIETFSNYYDFYFALEHPHG